MTTEEFSNEFDTLLNSYSNEYSINIDEYEKSIFLSHAQEEILLELYNGKSQFEDSFEGTEEIRRYLSNLVKTYTTTKKEEDITGLSDKSVFFKLPEDLWFIVFESVKLEDERLGCKNDRHVLVVPTPLDDYYNVYNNPFRGPGSRRVIRLDSDNRIVELISKYNIGSYLVRYLSRPKPIILVDLPFGLKIDGENKRMDCSLHPALHRKILDRSVKIAATIKGLITNNMK